MRKGVSVHVDVHVDADVKVNVEVDADVDVDAEVNVHVDVDVYIQCVDGSVCVSLHVVACAASSLKSLHQDVG